VHLIGNAPICASTVSERSYRRIHRYVTAPYISPTSPDDGAAQWAGAVGGLELPLAKDAFQRSEQEARHTAQRQLPVSAHFKGVQP